MVAEEMGYDDVVRLIQDHIDQDEQSDIDEPSDPDIDLLRDEAARYIQTIMRARIETDKKRKLTKNMCKTLHSKNLYSSEKFLRLEKDFHFKPISQTILEVSKVYLKESKAC